MPKDKRVDAYIEKAQPFAQPVLKHLRALIHEVVPEIQETIKWNFPMFDYKGPLCGIASFREHCSFGFWKTALLEDKERIFANNKGMGNLGRITGLKDLPPDAILKRYLREAVRLNEKGIKKPRPKTTTAQKVLVVPEELVKALAKNKKARGVFEAFSFTNRKDYADWISEAKTEETKKKRVATAMEWLAEGKVRNWKYMK